GPTRRGARLGAPRPRPGRGQGRARGGGRRWPDHEPRRSRTAFPPAIFRRPRQRLEYWGALRAFLRPYFLRSTSRASRVRKPRFFSSGRSSTSRSTRAREMAWRRAPAWPETPPPSRVARPPERLRG